MTRHSAPCPNCNKPASLSPDNPWRPFCSERCKLVDLGDWLEERRSIPGEPQNGQTNDGYDTQ